MELMKSEGMNGEVEVRWQDVDGVRWWIAQDIAQYFGFKKCDSMLRGVYGKGALLVSTLGGKQDVLALNEVSMTWRRQDTAHLEYCCRRQHID